MVQVTIKADDYYIGEAMAKLEAQIDNGIIDPIYDGETANVEVNGEHWSATFSKVD